METRDFCEMVFVTAGDGTRVVRIPDPITTIDPAIINSAAAQIIGANPFDATVGQLLDLKRADVVRVERTALIAPMA